MQDYRHTHTCKYSSVYIQNCAEQKQIREINIQPGSHKAAQDPTKAPQETPKAAQRHQESNKATRKGDADFSAKTTPWAAKSISSQAPKGEQKDNPSAKRNIQKVQESLQSIIKTITGTLQKHSPNPQTHVCNFPVISLG